MILEAILCFVDNTSSLIIEHEHHTLMLMRNVAQKLAKLQITLKNNRFSNLKQKSNFVNHSIVQE